MSLSIHSTQIVPLPCALYCIFSNIFCNLPEPYFIPPLKNSPFLRPSIDCHLCSACIVPCFLSLVCSDKPLFKMAHVLFEPPLQFYSYLNHVSFLDVAPCPFLMLPRRLKSSARCPLLFCMYIRTQHAHMHTHKILVANIILATNLLFTLSVSYTFVPFYLLCPNLSNSTINYKHSPHIFIDDFAKSESKSSFSVNFKLQTSNKINLIKLQKQTPCVVVHRF